MAYILGLVTKEEKATLKKRGWVLEKFPKKVLEHFGENDGYLGLEMVGYYVDEDLFKVMSGPGWDTEEKKKK